MKTFRSLSALCLLALGGSALSSQAIAQMTLTSAATTAGFKLTTFATGFPSSSNIGPLGVTFTADGGVLVNDEFDNLRRFATDTDGQTVASASNITYYGGVTRGMATIGGNYYMAQTNLGRIIQVNGDTSYKGIVISGLNQPLGMAVDPQTNHLFVGLNGSGKIIDLNPLTGGMTDVITGLPSVDGISVSADGKFVYGAIAGHLEGFNIATHTLVFNKVVPSVDGTALGYGTLDGYIFANTNDGYLDEFNLATGAETIIGQFGSRGDFVTVDPNNNGNSLLLTQTNSILRLTAPVGGSFVTPEPGPVALLVGMAVSGTTLLRRRRRK